MNLYNAKTGRKTTCDQIIRIFFVGGGKPLEIYLPHRKDEYDIFQKFVDWLHCDPPTNSEEDDEGPWGVFYWPGERGGDIFISRNAIAYVTEERR